MHEREHAYQIVEAKKGKIIEWWNVSSTNKVIIKVLKKSQQTLCHHLVICPHLQKVYEQIGIMFVI